ncbi:TRS31 [Auxenochlorella protothecoides x Auxenochlorella symbiontica]|uniref:Trafficking protein particle complex subunit n=1 Tax=Auxenochlorella protothecoides TaxID=3075 RepID=A0A087SPA5_AUXPR|nr:Trafficking protein particle complex subunit 5 [Auxenochlorella protothecoides]KFM27559.1 Trafficking protein particle complex subunit 5 [Auxenochlorella protothecoides]
MFSSRTQGGVVDRSLVRPRVEVNLSTFSYLFSELIQYCQARVSNIGELERRLDIVGFGVGVRLLELLSYRERSSRRDLKLLDALRFVHTTLWRYLFGRPAKDLEQSNNAEDEYMISDVDLFITKYISVPKEMGHLNCAAFVAGIVRGALDGAGFPSRVTAHNVAVPGQSQAKTTLLIKFDALVLQREQRLPSS